MAYNKSYMEMSAEVVTAMINRGFLKVVPDKGDDWKKNNFKSIHTVGWAILEMYRELQTIPSKAKEPAKRPAARIITK